MWVCWLDGKPAVRLDEAEIVIAAMQEFLKDREISAIADVDHPADDAHRSKNEVHVSQIQNTPLDAEPHRTGGRIDERHPIAIAGTIRTTLGRSEVILRDLSRQGCRFVLVNSSLSRGVFLTIRIGSIGPIDAEVMWSRGESVGVQFREPLHLSVFDHIRRASSFEGV